MIIDFLRDNMTEALLDENIPADLVAAYKKLGGDLKLVTRDVHDEQEKSGLINRARVIGGSSRKQASYKYDNVDYEQITPEQAIAFIKENPANISKLRILWDGDLVQFEHRGTPQNTPAIIGPRNKTIHAGDYTWSDISELKNLPNAKKFILSGKPDAEPHNNLVIYKTDEFAQPISPEEMRQRNLKGSYTAVSYPPVLHSAKENDPDITKRYNQSDFNPDAHDMRRNYSNSNVYMVPDIFNNQNEVTGIVDSGAHAAHFRTFTEEELYQLQRDKKRLLQEYNSIIGALKKLDTERDDISTDEAQRKEDRWLNRKAEIEQQLKEINIKHQKLVADANIDYRSAERLARTKNYLIELSDMLNKKHAIMQRLDNLSAMVSTGNQSISNAVYTALDRVNTKIRQLLANVEEGARQLDQGETNFEEVMGELPQAFVTSRKREYDDLMRQLTEVEERIKALRPHAEAKKAAIQAANNSNRQKELDPALANIIRFKQ